MSENTIAAKNLEKILSNEQGGMRFALLGSPESVGGNAGFWREFPCYGANFYFDEKTGEIIYFGNYQNVPKQITRDYQRGTFKIALNLRNILDNGKSQRIVGVYSEGQISPQALSVLEETAGLYNQEYGFPEE